MYDTLLQLPLFQGLCKNDFTNILEKVKLHFHKSEHNELIARQGDKCNKLVFILNGEVISDTVDIENQYSLQEKLTAPFVIEPYSLFGIKPFFQSTYNTINSADLISINKSFILSELNKYEIFRLNILNILSSRSQSAYDKLWNIHIGNTKEKIINFILLRCIRPDGEKNLNIKMEDFAHLINDTRINVSKTLNEMQEEGLVRLSRKEIFIPELKNLL